ncbi:unnamed protein product, partial [Rotaria magnacalcarata]
SSRFIGSNSSSRFELPLIRSPSIGSNPVDQFDLLTVNDQLISSQDHATSPIYDRHSPANDQSIVHQDLTTAPMYSRHSPANDQLISSQFLTTAPMYNSHQPVDTFFDVCESPSYNLPPPTPQLCFSEDSLYSDEEDEDKWLIKLEQENDSKIKNWDEKMKQEALEEFQEKWNEKVKKERDELIERMRQDINEQQRQRLIKKTRKKTINE